MKMPSSGRPLLVFDGELPATMAAAAGNETGVHSIRPKVKEKDMKRHGNDARVENAQRRLGRCAVTILTFMGAPAFLTSHLSFTAPARRDCISDAVEAEEEIQMSS